MSDLKCGEVRWTSGAAATLKQCHRSVALSSDSYPLILERRSGSGLHYWVLDPGDLNARITGSLLVLHNQKQEFPGWYLVKRYQKGWWATMFSDEPLGSVAPMPNPPDARPSDGGSGGVFVYDRAGFHRVGDATLGRELWDIESAEGEVFIGEPGLGVVAVIDLAQTGQTKR